MSSIREIFAQECAHVKIDKAFFRAFIELEQGFVNKKPEHTAFFGGTLTGVQIVRFGDYEFNRFFGDILEIDEGPVEQKVHDLPDINPNYHVSSDIFNIACVWLIYAAGKTKDLDEKTKFELQVRTALYLNYRFLTSILFQFFKYPANEDTAKATYAALTNRFVLKAQGSWSAALRYRSEELVGKDSIWRHVFDKLDDDYEVVKLLNDAQGRIKSMVKNIYAEFMKVHNSGKRISSTSAMVEIDGEIKLRDKTKGLAPYVAYVKGIAPRYTDFYKEELFEVVTSVVDTAPPHILLKFMNWFCENFLYISNREPDLIIELVMEHAFEYLSEHTEIIRKKEDIGTIILKIRGTYTSSRATDTKLLQIKERVEKMVRTATGSKNDSVVAATRTAFCLYLVVRAFTMKHYQSK